MQRAAAVRPPVAVPQPLVTTVLCAGLIAATAWAVLAGGWANNAGGAVVVAVVATVEAALLARAALPRRAVVVVAPLLALAAIVPTTLGAMPFDGDGTLGHIVGRYAAAIAGGLTAGADWPFTVGLCAVLWLCGFWVTWVALRERRGVLAVVPIFAVLATNVLNTHALDNVALPVALSVCLSLLVVAATHLESLQARWARDGIATLPGTQTRFTATVAAVSVLLTLFALLIPSLTSTDISARLFPGSGGGSPGSGAGFGGSPSPIEFNLATEPGGALVSHPSPVLTYSVDTNSPVYLRVVTDTQFLSGNWYPDHQGDGYNDIAWGGVSFSPGALPRDTALADGGVGRAQRTVHATIVMQASATGSSALVPFVGEPVALDRAGVAWGEVSVPVNPPGTVGASNGLLTVDSVRLDTAIRSGTLVRTTGTVSTATVPELERAGTDYPEFTKPYTNFADDYTHGAEVIGQLAAEWTQGIHDPYDMAVAIETRLRDANEYRYTLSPPQPPLNEWPIVWFLTESHRGYCQYFAAAMGAMLRSLGIPTRLVNGYGPGTTQALNGRRGVRQQVVTTSDAHTWVESYFPGYGWIPFEPTPPSSDGNYVPFARGAQAAAAVPPAPTARSTPAASFRPGFGNPLPAPNAGSAAAARGLSGAAVTGIVAGGVILLLAAALAWLWLPRSPAGAWRRLEALGIAWGMRRRPWETHREYAARFQDARLRDAASLLARMLGRSEFSRDGAGPAETRQAMSAWRRVLTGAPAFTWRRRHRHALAG